MNQRGKKIRSNDIDRISQLPEFLLQQIQSFLPDAARSIILSKPWLHAWSTRSFLHFDQFAFTSIDRKTFFELVTNTLAKCDQEGLSIEKFSLQIDNGSEVASLVDKWLVIVLRHKVQELNLIIAVRKFPRYILPAFTSNSLTVLELYRPLFELNDAQFPRCPNLKKLILRLASITDQTIQSLASSCPLLEEFHLNDCFGLGKIWVANLFNLKIFCCTLRCYISRYGIRVESPSLQSFSCSHFNMFYNGRLSIESYGNLRRFSAFTSNIITDTDTGLRDLLSQCPMLEDLSLHSCFLLERIHIASPSLKRLSLKFDFSNKRLSLDYVSPNWSKTVVEVTIDSPNLCFLEYRDYKLSYLSLISPLVRAQAQGKLTIRAGDHENLDAEWFCKLGSLLKRFKTSDLTLCAITPDTKEFISVPSLPIPEVEILNLCVENQVSLPFWVLVSGLFSTCHPKMILLLWDKDQEGFIRCLCNELLWRRSLNYSGSDGVSCWWSFLEDAKLEILSKTRGKWIQIDRKRFLAASMNLELGTEMRFSLKWCVAEEY